MNNTDDSFDDIQIEGEGGAFNEDAPEAQQPEMPTYGTVDDKWFLDPELDSIPVEIHVLDDIGYTPGTLSFL